MNEQDKELALRIACEGGIKDSFEFAHRYHTAKLEQYGKGFEEWRAKFYGPNIETGPEEFYERAAYQSGAANGAASREPEIQALRERIAVMDGAGQEQAAEIQALREEVDRLKAYSMHERDLGAEEGKMAANDMHQKLIAAQLDNKRLRDDAMNALKDALKFSELIECLGRTDCEIYKHELKANSDLSITRIEFAIEALSAPTNTDEADKLIKVLEKCYEIIEWECPLTEKELVEEIRGFLHKVNGITA